MPLLVVAVGSLVLAVRGAPTAAAGTPLAVRGASTAAANATCTASSCNFYFICNEGGTTRPLDCCADGTRGPGCFGACPDTHCGQVDAAPSMPKNIFEPEFATQLASYIAFTQSILIQDPFCGGKIDTPVGNPNPKLGTCASQGFKYAHANEPGRTLAWAGFPHGINPDFAPSTVLQQECLDSCGCCVNTSVLYNPGVLPECAADAYAPTRPPPCTNCPPSGCDGVCGLCAPSFNAPRFIDFYFTTKVQNVCEPRDGSGGVSAICSAATTPLACLAHPFTCAWRTPTSNGTCISTGTVAGTGPDLGKQCCSVFTQGPTCGFDCNACRTPGVNASIYGGRVFFSQCCDQCELCVASGNGIIATEASCGSENRGQYQCAWQKKK